jgi:hypothetical protein
MTRRRSVLLQYKRYYTIYTDYRCEDGRFLMSASWVTISDQDSLSSSETGVNPGIRSPKTYEAQNGVDNEDH